MIEVNKRYAQYAVFKAAARSAKDAPILHFGGPLELVLLGVAPAPRAGKEFEVRAAIGTRSATGHLAMVRHDRKLSPAPDVHPLAEVSFPGNKEGAEPVRAKVLLDQRCCNVQFYGSFLRPAEIGPGKAKVRLSFSEWTDSRSVR
jgi:hypothetical protein